MQYKQAYLDSRSEFSQKDPQIMADLAGGKYINHELIELLYLDHSLQVAHPSGDIQHSTLGELPHEEIIIIYQYLTGASGLPQRMRWLSFLELPGGPHHYVPFQQEAIFPLAKAFGDRPDDFLAAAKVLGGQEADLGHAGVVIPAFPRLPLAFMLWTADDEFPAAANILFDASAQTYLSTSSLYMLGIAVSRRLLSVG